MYYKDGLMVKITNPVVLAYLRTKTGATHTEVVENALCGKLGIPLKPHAPKLRGKRKKADCRNVVPIKVLDRELIDYVICQKKVYGICHRHTVEEAILRAIINEDK
ncbi:MAG: hypothetical protein PHS97_05525 [Oscillospiraceae bacterium]|nr:hypothetical protein [Oscillospiraceae bacterium]